MKILKTTNGGKSKLDDKDFYYFNEWKWRTSPSGYVVRGVNTKGKITTISLHREILHAQNNKEVDHINWDKLDNRRSNLRLCSRGQNISSRGLTKRNTSGYKGVVRWRTKWQVLTSVKTKFGTKSLYGGTFKDKKEAALAYNELARKWFGEFAYENIVT